MRNVGGKVDNSVSFQTSPSSNADEKRVGNLLSRKAGHLVQGKSGILETPGKYEGGESNACAQKRVRKMTNF